VDWLTDWLSAVVTNHPAEAYIVLFIAGVVENIFPPFPGDTFMVFGGYLVGRGMLSFWGTVGALFAGHIGAFMALVVLGRTLGRAALLRIGWVKRAEHFIDQAEGYAKRYGVALILANRFIPGARAVVSIVAGLLRMPTWKVLPAAVVSIALWNYLLTYAGSMVGENWEQVAELIARYNLIAGSVLVAAALVAGVVHYRKRSENKQG